LDLGEANEINMQNICLYYACCLPFCFRLLWGC